MLHFFAASSIRRPISSRRQQRRRPRRRQRRQQALFLFLLLLIFLRRFVRTGTRSPIWAICVPKISHFFLLKFPEAEPAWHTKPEFTELCAKIDHDRLGRQRPPGTQTSKKPICVPKLTAIDLRDSARLAHKPRKNRFVCQIDRDRLERQRRRKHTLRCLRNCHHDKPCWQQTKAGASPTFYKTFRRNMKRAQGQKRLRLRPSAAKIIAIYYVLVKNAEAGM